MSTRRLVPILAAAAIVALVAVDASACPNCKEAVAENSAGGGVVGASAGGDAAAGFNNAIYLALGTVFTLIGALGTRVYLAVRRADAA